MSRPTLKSIVGGGALFASLVALVSAFCAHHMYWTACWLGLASFFAAIATIAFLQFIQPRRWRVLVVSLAAVTFGGCGVFCTAKAARASALEIRMEVAYRLRSVWWALKDYRDEFGRYPPALDGLPQQTHLRPFQLDIPGREEPWAEMEETSKGYCYVAGLELDDPQTWPIVYEAQDENGDDGHAFLFLSSEIRWLSEEQAQEVLATFHDEYLRAHGHPPTLAGDCALDVEEQSRQP